MNQVDTLLDDIRRMIKDRSVEPEVKRYVNQELRELRPRIDTVTDADRHHDYLLEQVQAARERYQIHCAEDSEQHLAESPYDSTREDPVCTCSGRHAPKCPLKRGELPREVVDAADMASGIRAFRGNHNGNPLVLRDAQQSWSDEVAAVETELRELITVLSANVLPEGVDPEDTTIEV
jgi:hypothetical protein